MTSGDAFVRRERDTWTFGTATVQRVVALDGGRLIQRSLRRGAAGPELAPPGGEEFWATLGTDERVSSATPGWTLLKAQEHRLPQGELQLDLTLQRQALQVTKTYVVYPLSSVIREWVQWANTGATPVVVAEPGFLHLAAATAGAGSFDFHWMTGGENNPGSWQLKTEALAPGKPRAFDSYDAMAVETAGLPGDGINARILLNDRPIWPAEGWQYVANATVTVPFAVEADVTAGDKLVFLVNMHHNIGWDTTAYDPTIRYADGESHTASREFSDHQGQAGWRYQYLEGGRFVDLVYYPGPKQWRKAVDNATGTPFVGVGDQHPDVGQDAARVWTAPKTGHVRLTGTVCNTGNGTGAGGHGFRMGSSTYAPWNALYRHDTHDGLFVGWDYFGHWRSQFEVQADGSVTARWLVAGHHQTLAPGASLTTPQAFVGLFRDDLDDAGNECLDWQYRYLWDYTREREGWFPAIRMLGYWMKGTGWGQPGVSWTGGNPDLESTFRKVFRVADLMRSVGADVYHRDWGWWDRAGDWNGPDFRSTGEYLRKSGMGQLIYAFLYTVDGGSQVAREHPEWLIGGTLDMSQPAVVAFMQQQLETFSRRWGSFEWRNDSTPTSPRDGDDTPLLGQDQGLRRVIQGFLDQHPQCAFQAVNGGGNNTGYDYARFASTVSFSDGAVGVIRNYWAALLLPPDKTSDIPDIWNPDKYDPAVWRGLLCLNFDMTGDTWDPAKLEGLRQLIDIYHYLHHEGVVGRWVRVYRPQVQGDDPTMYFQRLSGDRRRGLIIPKHPAPGPLTIHPRGLLPGEEYDVSFQEATSHSRRSGAELMAAGIRLEQMAPGELIYLNLPYHPGNRRDTTPPTAPTGVRQRAGRNLGYPGIELTWQPGTDDHWVSYYEVLRGGTVLDKVARGTFYFDHSAGADAAAKYAVRTVDGAGNASPLATAQGAVGQPAQVFDATPGGGLELAGEWRHQTGLAPAHAGTLASANQAGATAKVSFAGTRVLLFAKLGADGGQADVQVDDRPAARVDTYSADDIWGACVYEQAGLAPGRHTLTVTVSGRHQGRSQGDQVALDGVRAEAP